MRHVLALAAVVLLASHVPVVAEETAKCKVEGLHLCCQSCENVVNDVLKNAKVDNVSVDRKSKTVTFEADPTVCQKAITALYSAGFAGKGSIDGKAFVVAQAKLPVIFADEITVKNVHLCCGSCQSAVKALFKGSTVTPQGKGVQRDIVIAGKGLSAEQVMAILNKGGFSGTIEVKK